MKTVHEKSKRNQERRPPLLETREFLESMEDHHSNDESPEDHCCELESQASPSLQHAKLSHGGR